MAAAETTPDTPAMIALASLFEISIRVLQVPQLVADKLFNWMNFLKGIRSPQHGQLAIWFLDIGYWKLGLVITIPEAKVEKLFGLICI